MPHKEASEVRRTKRENERRGGSKDVFGEEDI